MADEHVDRDDLDLPVLPPEFWTWDAERQIDWIQTAESRRGLILKLRLEAGIDAGEPERAEYLTGKDLAAIYRRILELKDERK